MPELPEVETVARGLRLTLPGRRIASVRLGKTDFIDDPTAVEHELPAKTIVAVRRFGKFLLLDLESSEGAPGDSSLLIHLGMTGQLVTCQPEAPVAPHTHAFFVLDDGRELRYTDVRRFGRIAFLANGAHEAALGKLGLEPLEATEKQFAEKLRGRRAPIKSVLLNQHVLRGIGNIYADEGLWRARIHPVSIAANLSAKEARRLYRAVQTVLNEAIRLRGSSVSDYVDAEGERGEFQLRHRVYQREGKKCPRCGATIRRIIVGGRSSHFCPKCQRAPREAKKSQAATQRGKKTKSR
ncbi:MAG TPA: bifunctional DNA-formamidopyrimidine glycosylase/DNA-(apurinic or apyrimidinic site) lyase [Candidatus Acidoferrales bacterium]|nr:bifunctional DNA-formamidopyrimidine glycosylase/DNA-(apurinic or apyrimidinic site) lyase [Candidatus Acidoferrales bacterium]